MITLSEYSREITDASGVRHYYCESGHPHVSVTTLLSKYEYNTILENWKIKRGDEANVIRQEASERGTFIHSRLEEYLDNRDSFNMDNIDVSCFEDKKQKEKTLKYVKTLIREFFQYVSPVVAEEALLVNYNGNRYGGRYDSVVNIPANVAFYTNSYNALEAGNYLIDIKSKNSLPRLDDSVFLLKNMLQMAAYFTPLQKEHELKGAILVYSTATKCVPVLLDRTKLKKLFSFFVTLLEDYYTPDSTKSKKDLWLKIKTVVDCYYDVETSSFNNHLPQPIYLCLPDSPF